MWLILRKHTESIFRVSGEREEEGCFIMQEGRDPLSLITWVIIIVTVSFTVFNTAGALVVIVLGVSLTPLFVYKAQKAVFTV